MKSVPTIVLAAGSSLLLCHASLGVSAEDKSKEGKEEKDHVFKGGYVALGLTAAKRHFGHREIG